MHAKQKGYTLIELLVVIAIIAIMAAIAMPNMSNWIAARRSASQAESIANLLRFARSEAVRLNLPVYVCPTRVKKDGNVEDHCNAARSGEGMVAFADGNKDKVYTRSTGTGKDFDIDLRAIILGGENKDGRVTHQFATTKFDGSPTGNSNQVWVFNPDGTFGHAASLSAKFDTGTGYVKIAMTDKDAATPDEKQSRSAVVLINPGGRVEVCSKSDTRPLCQYPSN
ncbi:GspH/FimT family pseudopilin [Neisseria sp.]|uniref:GspH/FimT family pseudopilin n=1 Tax=Neisseria sp. TaxID=192066 RepID=UPI0035A03B73